MACAAAGPLGARAWFDAKKELEQIQRVIIADAELTGLDLRNFSFLRCYIIRVNFNKSDLRGCNFRQSIVRNTDFTESDIGGANFRLADLGSTVTMLSVLHDSTTDFGVGPGNFPEKIDIALHEMAQNAWRKDGILRNRSTKGFYRAILYLTDYGENINRLTLAATSIVISYSVIYFLLGPVEGHDSQRVATSILNSVRYFFALTDPYEGNILLSVLGISETMLGLVGMAILLSVITRRLIIVK